MNAVGVGGALEFSYGMISAKDQVLCFEKSVTSDKTIKIMYVARHQKYCTFLDNATLNEEVDDITDTNTLFEQYGTHYVGRIM